jgi:cytochrome c oxidase subunit 2
MAPFKTKSNALRVVGLLLAAMSFAACAEGYKASTMVTMTSDFGPDINSLYSMFVWISVVVFVVVEALIIYAVFRFRKKGDEAGLPEQVHGHTVGEIAWTIAPALIVLFITIPTIKTIFKLAEVPTGSDTVRVKVIGKQWWWAFEYPDLGVVTANELHLPVGKTAVFEIVSDDVIHSFWFPNAGGKRDATPGHVNTMYFTPVQKGEFYGQCAEFCGTSHANMRMYLHVESEEDFQQWVEKVKAEAPADVTDAAVVAGRDAFMSNCAACHAVTGVADFGTFGPNLNLVGARKTIGSGMYDNTDENLFQWIKHPQVAKPGSKMVLPQELDDETVNNLVAFLRSLK